VSRTHRLIHLAHFPREANYIGINHKHCAYQANKKQLGRIILFDEVHSATGFYSRNGLFHAANMAIMASGACPFDVKKKYDEVITKK
jgi:hypothetical protein